MHLREIERIEAPTRATFLHEYVRAGKPVVIAGGAKGLPQSAWDFDGLSDLVGDVTVPVYDWGASGPTVDDEFVITKMPFAEAIELTRSVTSTEKQQYAVCQLPLEHVGHLAELYRKPSWLEGLDQIDRPALPFRESSRHALFISFHRGIHWHNGRDAVAQLLTGRKRFVLFDPKDSPYLYPRRLADGPKAWFDETEAVFCSEIPFEQGLDAIDRKKYPLFDRTTPYTTELQAGDCLFIPTHWWHFTTAVDPCVVAVEFWDAPLRRWGYPNGRRSLIMKPYRKYLFRHLAGRKAFTRRQEVMERSR
ncbi:cupin-like domain-containing protein [Streptomyces sp. NPDC054796]